MRFSAKEILAQSRIWYYYEVDEVEHFEALLEDAQNTPSDLSGEWVVAHEVGEGTSYEYQFEEYELLEDIALRHPEDAFISAGPSTNSIVVRLGSPAAAEIEAAVLEMMGAAGA